MHVFRYLLLFFLLLLFSCSDDNAIEEEKGLLQLQSVRIGTMDLIQNQTLEDAPVDKGLIISFSETLNKETTETNITISNTEGIEVPLTFHYLDEDKTVSAIPESDFEHNTSYTVQIGTIQSIVGNEFPGAEFTFKTIEGSFLLEEATINGKELKTSARITNIPLAPQITLTFSDELNPENNFEDFISITNKGTKLSLGFTIENDKTLQITSDEEARDLAKYTLTISSNLKSINNFKFDGFTKEFYTQLDSTFKFPEINDEELLTKVQQQTFKYFWDFAHPNSGLARERNTSGDLVTIGGSGFGIMTILVGIHRNFITRQQGVERLAKITNFLSQADRFHGVWPHWMNGNTGETIAFSEKDNGADLVESAFMIQGLLTARAFLDESIPEEAAIINVITTLWQEVEWSWFTKGGENVLYWHWSPDYGWEMNHTIRGWNESLIVYTLAASSPTYPISKEVYEQGWAQNGNIMNGNQSYGITKPLGSDRGGPLFFAHYSFMGMDPRNLQDQYANYWEQNVAHSQINRAYVIDNPLNYVGYSEDVWGLTASDNHEGYSAHSPYNDLGVITPTAALSSIPYTPEASMDAIKHFYYLMGDRLWGEYGFYDAFNITADWYANSYLAIDQGPIIIMIENHRTGFIWDLYMSDPEVQAGLTKLGFTY
ncbi:Ig-like domain-containing protein [Marivirga sp. S37H4]|uniref:Ig-like domain-containing protein n=1 Tax=Marivirga aurantiaca TaxID=2802615 RepID=A0A934WYA1_9BACT|nr:glucoamylase family protein [Marivirga aurantiaca]MBK6265050.1 Ig-like domain-containing protein [Marivirga aurantiaca]